MAGNSEKASASETAEVQAIRADGMGDDDVACPSCGNRVNANPTFKGVGQCSVCQRTYALDDEGLSTEQLETTTASDAPCPNCGQGMSKVKGHSGLALCNVCGTAAVVDGVDAIRLSDVRR